MTVLNLVVSKVFSNSANALATEGINFLVAAGGRAMYLFVCMFITLCIFSGKRKGVLQPFIHD